MALKLKPVYMLLGDDEASIHERVEALKDAFHELYGELTVEVYDAASDAASALYGSLMSPSLLSGNRLVLVRSFEKWASSPKKGTDEAIAAIANEYLVSPDPGTVLVLVGSKLPKKTRAWKQLEAAVRGHAGTKPNVLEYTLPREWDMHLWVAGQAATAGLEMDRDVAEYLLAVAGSDAMTIHNELQKLKFYLASGGRKKVSRGDIDMLVIPRSHMSEFKLVEALSRGDIPAAEKVLSQLAGKTGPSQLSYAVAKELRLMAEVRRLQEDGASDAKMKAALKSGGFFRMEPTDWVLRQLKQRAGLFDQERLVRAFRELSELDLSLKGVRRTKLDERFLLERCMYRMGSRPGGRNA